MIERDIESQVLDALHHFLKGKGNTKFALMVNYELITTDEGKKTAYCRCDSEDNSNVEIGVIVREEGKSKFKTNQSLKKLVMKKVSNLRFGITGEIDLASIEDLISVSIEVNMQLRTINIVQSVFKSLMEKIYVKNELTDFTLGDRIQISSEEAISIYKRMDLDSFYNYSKVLTRRAFLLLNKNPLLRMYNVFPAFQPLFLKGKCIFNPMLEAKANMELFKNSKLYEYAKDNFRALGDGSISVSYLTDEEISESLNFKKVIKCSLPFIVPLLGGIVNELLPRESIDIYIDRNDSNLIISKETYMGLSDVERGLYIPGSTLLLHCNRMYRGTSVEPDILYSTVSNFSLLSSI